LPGYPAQIYPFLWGRVKRAWPDSNGQSADSQAHGPEELRDRFKLGKQNHADRAQSPATAAAEDANARTIGADGFFLFVSAVDAAGTIFEAAPATVVCLRLNGRKPRNSIAGNRGNRPDRAFAFAGILNI